MSFDVGSNFSIESALDAEVERKKANDKLGRTEFLTVLTNPNLILILGMIGIYGLII